MCSTTARTATFIAHACDGKHPRCVGSLVAAMKTKSNCSARRCLSLEVGPAAKKHAVLTAAWLMRPQCHAFPCRFLRIEMGAKCAIYCPRLGFEVWDPCAKKYNLFLVKWHTGAKKHGLLPPQNLHPTTSGNGVNSKSRSLVKQWKLVADFQLLAVSNLIGLTVGYQHKSFC